MIENKITTLKDNTNFDLGTVCVCSWIVNCPNLLKYGPICIKIIKILFKNVILKRMIMEYFTKRILIYNQGL